jgi:ribosomal protein S18 acetylase RimI-like enzyme
MPARVSVSAVSAANLPGMLALMGAIEAERLPAEPEAFERAMAEVRLSLSLFDFTRSDSCRMLLASVVGVPVGSGSSPSAGFAEGISGSVAVGSAGSRVPAGYALVVRIPKPDARVGFLFVEELYVLATHRRGGVASALLRECESVARDWRLNGIRLLVRTENAAARHLYHAAGYAESTTAFCEKILA